MVAGPMDRSPSAWVTGLVAALVMTAAACTGSQPGTQPTPSPTLEQTRSPATPDPATPEPSADVHRPRPTFREYDLPAGARPHDVAPAARGPRVWFTAQSAGYMGLFNPRTGRTKQIPLGSGSAPHGVIVGPDGDAWGTDGGLNAIVRIDADTHEVTRYPLEGVGSANLNTAAFDGDGILWFTGQNGYYGRVNPRTGRVRVFDAPRGTGPYGIAATPDGTVWYASLAGSYIARIRPNGRVEVVDVPTPGGGARRIWSDSRGRLWVTEWNAGKLARYTPATERWREWDIPGSAQPYAVFVDERDDVWVTDFGANALWRFRQDNRQFRRFPLPSAGADVRQLLGRPGQVWGAESGTNKLVVLRT